MNWMQANALKFIGIWNLAGEDVTLTAKKNPHIYPFITSSSPEINSIRSASFDFHDSTRILSDALDFDECTNKWVVARC